MIDPRKIAEWKDAAQQSITEGAGGDRLPATWVVALVAEREELLALLRECADPKPARIEGSDLILSGCPLCAKGWRGAHAPDCRLAAALASST